jgi:cellulose synthase (UDP-forming)
LWNATFFCGSCAIIRRVALAQTNGFAGETVTEDAHTALKLQRMGWNTAYISARLSAGLATERLVLHIGQRIRWARGMTQILRIENPLLGRGLTWQQRLCYLNAMLHFQYPLPRIVFLTSQLAYLIFGQNIIQASASLIFAYAAPHLFCSSVANERVQGGDRRPFWGEVYETILCFHLVKPTVMTWFQPRKGKFNVTDKGSLLDKTHFDWAVVKPHLICIALMATGIVLGVVKRVFFPHLFNTQTDTLVLNLAWATFSLIILLAAVSVAREKRQVRTDIRIPVKLSVTAHLESGHVVPAHTLDISMGGAAISLPKELPVRDRTIVHLTMAMGDETLAIPVETVRTAGDNAYVRFGELDIMAGRHLVRAVMGRADAWQPTTKHESISGISSIKDIIVVDLVTVKRLLGLNRAERAAMRRQQATPNSIAAKAAGLAAALVLGATALLSAPDTARAAPAPAVAAAPAAAAKPAAPGGEIAQRLTLKDLRIKQPVRLQGTRGEIGIPFGMRQDRVVTDAAITLQLAWSPAMLDDLTQLVVILNGEIVRTMSLTRANSAGMTVTVPINPALFLPGDNQLNLRLIGHYARDCEDPFHSALWANVSNTRSFLDLHVQRIGQRPDLARLPGPFFDKGENKALNLPFVFAGQPHAGELQAAASIASWMGSLASYRGFAFPPVYGSLPTGNAVVFLTQGTNIDGIPLSANGPSAAVVPNPRDPLGTLLVIMGRDSRELSLAAAAVASGRGVFGGSQMAFDGVRIPTYPAYGAPRWIPTDHAVRLGDVMPAYAMQGLGLPPGPLNARFKVSPDLFFWPRQGGKLNLAYRYPVASWLDKRASRLDLSINGQYLKTLPLAGGNFWDQWFGGSAARSSDSKASVVLPRYNMFGQNELTFDYNLIIADKKKCTGTLPENVRVSLDPNSTIDLTSAYHGISMPDLATFAGSGFPFTIRPDLAETTVLMAPDPSPASVRAFLTLMGRMGDSTGVATTGVTVTSELDGSELTDHDILVIGSSALAGASGLFKNAPLHFDDGVLRVTERSPLQYVEAMFGGLKADDPSSAENVVYGSRDFSGIVSFRSPFDAKRTVVALLADDGSNLPLLVDGLFDDKVNASIQGDLAVTTGEGMTSFAIGETYWIGSLPLWMRAAYWFSQRPVLMGLFAVLIAAFLAGPAYLYFRGQARRRLGEKDLEV